MLKSLGFLNPAKYVDEYTQSYGAQCPHCDYKSIAKRKVTRHIQQVHRPRQVTL
jgi:DNA-directed RNA polymerase subunit RPC12/RpoP